MQIGAILGGFALLVWSADRFVIGASALARILNVSPLIIGLVIVGFGTSAPELLVSAIAAWGGNPGLSVGNAIGSNITNIALVLGATALTAPLMVASDVLRRELPLLILTIILAALLLMDGKLSVLDGIILLSGLGAFIYWMAKTAMKNRSAADPLSREFDEEIPKDMPLIKAVTWLILGLVVLLIAARIVVWGAIGVAQAMGISDLVIGLTVVAVGTSLPELAASVMSARKGEHDIAIGNVIGSNMFNLLGVLGIPAIIAPQAIDNMVVVRDYPIMCGLTIALYFMAKSRNSKLGHINRWEGAVLVLCFVSYIGLLFYTA